MGWIEIVPSSREIGDVVAQILLELVQHTTDHANGRQPSFQFQGHWAHIWNQYLLGTPIPIPPCSPWGKAERAYELIKQHLTNFSIKVRFPWPSLLPFVLTHPWTAPYSTTDLSPFVLLYRWLFLLNHFPAQKPPLARHPPYFSLLGSHLHSQAGNSFPAPMLMDQTALKLTPLFLGDWILF